MDFSHEPDLRHRVRRMRAFEDLFEKNLIQLNDTEHLNMSMDRARLRAAFLTWLDNFGQTRPFAVVNRRDFTCYSAGRMFAELIRHHVIDADDGDRYAREPVRIWPEGYAYANFCLAITLNVLAQDGNDRDADIGILRDQRMWQSFRENAIENPDIAVAFFDLVLGRIPNWKMPQLVERRPAMQKSKWR